MANLNIEAKNIEGLLPALDARAVEKPFVVEGQNFSFGVKGPFAAFANTLAGFTAFVDPIGFDAFEVGDCVFHMFNDGVFEFDFNSQEWVLQFPFNGLIGVARWSTALVGAQHYFCREGVGLLQYTPATGIWKLLTTNVPTNAISVTRSNGRLVVLGDDNYAWSALDDGADLAPSLTTGAGAQSTAIIGGDSIAVAAYNQGFLTYTSKGVIRAAFIGGSAVFRHSQLTARLKLYNKFSIVNLDNEEHVILTNLGLFVTSGTSFEQLDPVFNEFVRDLLAPLDASLVDAIRLFFDDEDEVFFLSQAFADNSHIFNKAFVFLRRLRKWGSFNHEHFGFSKINFATGPDKGQHFGYIGADKHFHYLTFNASVENAPALLNTAAVRHQKAIEYPVYKDSVSGITTVSSVAIMDTFDPNFIPDGLTAGFYTLTETTEGFLDLEGMDGTLLLEGETEDSLLLEGEIITKIPARIPRNLAQLDSKVTVGLFNFFEGEFPDEISLVTNVAASAGFVPVGQTIEDWNLLSGAQDWNLLSGFVDRGEGLPSAEIFDISLVTSNDGVNTASYGGVLQDVSLLPSLYKDDGRFAFFSAYQVGLFHKLRLETNNPGDSFQLDLLEISGSLAGRP